MDTGKSFPWGAVAGSIFATLVVVAAGVGGYLLGSGSGEDLDRARAAGRADARDFAASAISPARERQVRRAESKTGFKRGYREAFVRSRREIAASGPRVCGDARTDETPVVVKVRAEGIGCQAALEFARDALACQDLDQECQGYTCSHVSTGYEEGETTCTREGITIRFLTGV